LFSNNLPGVLYQSIIPLRTHYYIHEHITTSVVPYIYQKFRLCVAHNLKISSNTYMYFNMFLIIM